MTIAEIKSLGLIRSAENLQKLLALNDVVNDVELKREIVSSIGRQNDDKIIFDFISGNVYNCGFMDVVYQMYRTCLYKGRMSAAFETLGKEIRAHFNNEILDKMHEYFSYKRSCRKILSSRIAGTLRPSRIKIILLFSRKNCAEGFLFVSRRRCPGSFCRFVNFW